MAVIVHDDIQLVPGKGDKLVGASGSPSGWLLCAFDVPLVVAYFFLRLLN